MKRHILWMLCVILVGSMLLAACAPATAPAPQAGQAPAAAKPAEGQPAAAGFDWQMRKGEKLRVAMVKQPWSEFIEKSIGDFKTLTGIDVTYEILPEDQFRQKTTVEFAAGTSDVDVFLSMVAQEGIKYETAGWYQDLEALVHDPKITSPTWSMPSNRRSLTKPASPWSRPALPGRCPTLAAGISRSTISRNTRKPPGCSCSGRWAKTWC
jgi:ABC-type glycerol-3-phosphate transport system substrate-binding protein